VFRSKSTYLCTTGLLTALITTVPVAAGVRHSEDPDTGLQRWQWEGSAAAITLTQRLPDQTRAFFQGRGFAAEDAEPLAADCLFQAEIRNRSEATMSLALDRWRVTAASGQPQPIRLEAQWQEEWAEREVPQAARIAFRWSLFPTRQTFAPGDWNMGMVTMGLSEGDRFDLLIPFTIDGSQHQVTLEGLQCAPDRTANP